MFDFHTPELFLQFFACLSSIFSISIVLLAYHFPKMIQRSVFMRIIILSSFCDLFASVAMSFGFPRASSQACSIQGALISFFYRASFLWLFCFACQLHRKLFLRDIHMHLFVWSICLFLELIPLAVSEEYGIDDSLSQRTICQLKTDATHEQQMQVLFLELLFMGVIVLAMLLMGALCLHVKAFLGRLPSPDSFSFSPSTFSHSPSTYHPSPSSTSSPQFSPLSSPSSPQSFLKDMNIFHPDPSLSLSLSTSSSLPSSSPSPSPSSSLNSSLTASLLENEEGKIETESESPRSNRETNFSLLLPSLSLPSSPPLYSPSPPPSPSVTRAKGLFQALALYPLATVFLWLPLIVSRFVCLNMHHAATLSSTELSTYPNLQSCYWISDWFLSLAALHGAVISILFFSHSAEARRRWSWLWRGRCRRCLRRCGLDSKKKRKGHGTGTARTRLIPSKGPGRGHRPRPSTSLPPHLQQVAPLFRSRSHPPSPSPSPSPISHPSEPIAVPDNREGGLDLESSRGDHGEGSIRPRKSDSSMSGGKGPDSLSLSLVQSHILRFFAAREKCQSFDQSEGESLWEGEGEGQDEIEGDEEQGEEEGFFESYNSSSSEEEEGEEVEEEYEDEEEDGDREEEGEKNEDEGLRINKAEGEILLNL